MNERTDTGARTLARPASHGRDALPNARIRAPLPDLSPFVKTCAPACGAQRLPARACPASFSRAQAGGMALLMVLPVRTVTPSSGLKAGLSPRRHGMRFAGRVLPARSLPGGELGARKAGGKDARLDLRCGSTRTPVHHGRANSPRAAMQRSLCSRTNGPRLFFPANFLRFRATCAARPRAATRFMSACLSIAALALFRQAASLLASRPFAARGDVHGGRGVAHGGPSALTGGGSSRGSRWPPRARRARRSPALRLPTAPPPPTV